jgi:PAS domain-containing protein
LARDAGMKGEEIDHRLVVDATPALIFSARPDGHVDYFNRRWFVLLGARQDQLEGWGWTKFIHPVGRVSGSPEGEPGGVQEERRRRR